jgi:hypothetical protein
MPGHHVRIQIAEERKCMVTRHRCCRIRQDIARINLSRNKSLSGFGCCQKTLTRIVEGGALGRGGYKPSMMLMEANGFLARIFQGCAIATDDYRGLEFTAEMGSGKSFTLVVWTPHAHRFSAVGRVQSDTKPPSTVPSSPPLLSAVSLFWRLIFCGPRPPRPK